MKKRKMYVKGGLAALVLTPLFCLTPPAFAQSAPAQDNRPAQDRDINRDELARFDQFLDSHREIAEQVRKDPSLVNREEFVKNHPALQAFLQDHPGIREQLRQNPDAFMHAENRYDRREDNRDRQELASFNRFLEDHREISEQLRRDPSLASNERYVKDHPELQAYLQDHPAVRQQINQNPNAFMETENRFDRREDDRDRDINHDRDRDFNRDRDRDRDRQELANFDRFLDGHREIAEQLHRDPSLVDSDRFVKDHPALQTYLQDHPAVRDQLKQNPNGFMAAENRFDQHEDLRYRRNDFDRDDMHRHFGEFLNNHSDLAQRLSQNPALVKDHEFVESHPELKEYLNANPEARQQLMANPQNFVKSSQQFSTNGVKPPPAEPKPHQ